MQTNNELITRLYTKSHIWLTKCAYNFTKNEEQAEELLQEVYLYLLEMPNIEKIIFNKTELNLLYIYRIIKTRYLKSISKNNTIGITEDVDCPSDDYDYIADADFERTLAIVQHELSDSGSLYWFDKRLLQVYIDDDHSLTSLSEATKISRSACWNSISKTKKHLKNKVYGSPKS
jgi:DNA-directed RNA polymerase specialized sigma24 family protein